MNNNTIMVNGNLAFDPELSQVGEHEVAKFKMAVNNYGDREADFFRVEVWGKAAKPVMDFCHKGKKVSVVGRMQLNEKEVNGERKIFPCIKARDVEFLGGDRGGSDDDNEF